MMEVCGKLTGGNVGNLQELGTAPVGKLLWRYAVPAVIALTVTSLYNIIDSIFIGHGVGALALSGLAIDFPLMNLLVAFCTLVSVGGSSVLSIRLGQRNTDDAKDVLGNVTILCLVNSVIIGGMVLLFMDRILQLFGASEGTLPYARGFLQVILLGCPVSYLMLGLNSLLQATGYPGKAMVASLLTVGCNLILAPVFIFVFGWGIKGAALGTVLSQLSALAWGISHFCSKRSHIHFDRRHFRLKRHIVRDIFSIGLSPFLMNICGCLVVVFINNRLLHYGDDLSIGAFGILNRIQMLFLMIVMGIAAGMQPINGYNYGAGKTDRLKRTLKLGLVAGCCVTGTGFVVSELFPYVFTGIFTDNEELLEQSQTAMRIGLMLFPLVGIQTVTTQFFQSIGKVTFSIFLSLSRQLLFLLPGLALLPSYWGVSGVWLSIPLADALSAATALGLLSRYFHKYR